MNKHITQSIVVNAVVSAVVLMVNVVPGAVFIQIVQSQLDKFGDMKFESLSGANARKIVLVIGIMSAHALGEGCGVGVSFCGTRGWAQVTTHLQHICHITEA